MSEPEKPAAADDGDILDEIQDEVAAELEDQVDPGGPAYQVVGALVALALGLTGAVLAYGYGLGSLHTPGPGMWPFVVSVLISGLAVILLLTGRGLQDTEVFTRSSWQPIIGSLTFLGMALLMPVIGFEIPALLLAAIWLKFLGGESWRVTVVGSVLMVLAFYLLFIWVLRIPIPHLF